MPVIKKKRKPYKKTNKLNNQQKADLRTLIESRIQASIIFHATTLEDNVELVRAIVVSDRELNDFIKAL